jgi:transcription antitermination factor NusG
MVQHRMSPGEPEPARGGGRAGFPESVVTEVTPRWCVARTKPSAEAWALTNLNLRGHEVYLPLCTVRRRDRLRSLTRTVQVPLFRSYLFVQHVPGESWRAIHTAPGVSNLITVAGRIEYAAAGVVEALRATEQLRRSIHPSAQLCRPGAACRLLSGPFYGHDAVVSAIEGDSVVVSVMMFGELRRVVVPLESLGPREN